jgi:quinol monooxygenase YgiN
MITVIASITVKAERKSEFIELVKANVPAVLAEAGCIEYAPTVDLATGLPPQILGTDVVTIIERWQSVAALKDHLAAPHMLRYRERVKEMVTGVTIKVLQAV